MLCQLKCPNNQSILNTKSKVLFWEMVLGRHLQELKIDTTTDLDNTWQPNHTNYTIEFTQCEDLQRCISLALEQTLIRK